MITLMYLVRPGDHNPELQYSLRSIEKNLLVDDIEVVFVGHCPRWADPDRFVVGNKQTTGPDNVWDNVKIGCEDLANALGRHEVVVMNDDFFVLEPVTEILPTYRGLLSDHLALLGPNAGNWWARSLRDTRACLTQYGLSEELQKSYDLHRPFPVIASDMAETLAHVEESWGRPSGVPPQWRTIYGNLVGMDAVQADDVRLRRSGGGREFGSSWVSTSDDSWRIYSNRIMPGLEQKSRWER